MFCPYCKQRYYSIKLQDVKIQFLCGYICSHSYFACDVEYVVIRRLWFFWDDWMAEAWRLDVAIKVQHRLIVRA